MKTLKTLLYIFCLSYISTFTLQTFGQTKENANFNAGVKALDANNMPLAYTKFAAGAKEGHADSQFNVALMNEQGIGVSKNEKEAVAWYTKAAEQGNAAAQYNLGVLYENGRGATVNFANAHKWYRKAAVQGDGLAIGNLGMLYIRGQGVKENKIAGMALLMSSVTVDPSPENNAKSNLSTTKGLTVAMIGEAQALSEKLNNAKNLLVPLDAYLKKP